MLEAAEIVCCTLEGDSCEREVEGGDCRSGHNDDVKVTWNEAQDHCEEAGMRLCNSQEELDQCCGTGCQYDNQLVWSGLKEGIPFFFMRSMLMISSRFTRFLKN